MRSFMKLYNRVKRRTTPTKSALLFPTTKDGQEVYSATINTMTGGGVPHGGKFSGEERFFLTRDAALRWILESVEEKNVMEVVFSNEGCPGK